MKISLHSFSFLRFALPLAALGLMAPSPAFAQKGSSSTASGATVIPGGVQAGAYVISKSGAYVLGGDRLVSDSAQNVIEITASDVTLDLGGFSLRFAEAATGAGVAISIPTAVNVEVRNGSISNVPGYAVQSTSNTGDTLRLLNLRVSDTGGIFSAAANTLVQSCHVSDTHQNAAIRAVSRNAVVRDCHIDNVPQNTGIKVGGGALVVGNVLDNIGYSGISVQTVDADGYSALVANNQVRRANSIGHDLHSGILVAGQGVCVRGNNVNGAKASGIRASGACHVIESNTITFTYSGDAPGAGAMTSQSVTNILRNNSTSLNSGGRQTGLYLDGGGNVGS
jgi:hypothetical protein